MRVLLSPSKTMNTAEWQQSEVASRFEWTKPAYQSRAARIIDELKGLSVTDIQKLMGVSKKIAEETASRHNHFKKSVSKSSTRPALLLYSGDVYRGIEAEEYNRTEWKRAQERIRIISGLYGLLRPGDLIQPYRLEMRIPLAVDGAKDLYHFWQPVLGKALQKELKAGEPVLNLASREYAAAIEGLKSQPVTVHFKEERKGSLKVIGLLAKRARGRMADFIVRENVKNLDGVCRFAVNGYQFRSDLSDDLNLVFVNKGD